jgi:hypothetical protein
MKICQVPSKQNQEDFGNGFDNSYPGYPIHVYSRLFGNHLCHLANKTLMLCHQKLPYLSRNPPVKYIF